MWGCLSYDQVVRKQVCDARGNWEVSVVHSVPYLRSFSLMNLLALVAAALRTGGTSTSSAAGGPWHKHSEVSHRVEVSSDQLKFRSVCKQNNSEYISIPGQVWISCWGSGAQESGASWGWEWEMDSHWARHVWRCLQSGRLLSLELLPPWLLTSLVKALKLTACISSWAAELNWAECLCLPWLPGLC